MLPQFVTLGPTTLNVYTLLIALATLLSLGVAWWQTRDGRVFGVALIVAVFALAFGRAGYVALHLDYFREHGNEIASLTGLSEHGAILGASVGYWLLVSTRQLTTNNQYGSLFAIALTLLGVAASLGCIPNGCAYGREVFWQTDGEYSLAWLLRADWPDAFGVNNPRWPTQLMIVAWLLLTGALLWTWTRGQSRLGRQGRGGRHGSNNVTLSSSSTLSALSFCAGDFLLQFLRGDPIVMVAGLRLYQWLDLGLITLLALWFLILARVETRAKVVPKTR